MRIGVLYFLITLLLLSGGCSNSKQVDEIFGSEGDDLFGSIGNSAISLSPIAVDFGPLPVNNLSGLLTVTIENVATVPIYLADIAASSAQFSVVASTCPNGSTPLPGGQRCNVRVRFNPTVAGELSSTLGVRFSGDPGGTEYVSYGSLEGISTTDLIFPGLESIDQIRSTSVRLNWTDVANENGYAYFRVNGAVLEFLGTAPRDSTSAVVTGLAPLTSYQFRVRAIDFYGNYDNNTVNLPAITLAPVTLTDLVDRTFDQMIGPVVAGSLVSFDLNNTVSGDDAGMSYQCFYDLQPDGAVANTLACSSLPDFTLDPGFSANGELSLNPTDSFNGRTFEIRVTGSDGGTTDDEIVHVNVVSPYVRNANLLVDYQADFASILNPGSNNPFTNTLNNLVFGGASLDGDLSFGTWSTGWAGDGTLITDMHRLVFDGISGPTADRVVSSTGLNGEATPMFTTWIRPANLSGGLARVFGVGGNGSDGWSLMQTAAGTYQFSVGNGGGDSQTVLLGFNPQIYLNLNEPAGPTATNAGSISQNATFTNPASVSVGLAGAYSGSTAFRTVNNGYLAFSPEIDIGTSWTIMAWIEFPINHHASWKTLTRGSNHHHIIFATGSNELGSYISTMRSSGFDADSLSPGWHHVAAVASGSTTTFYVDGAQVGSPINFVADDTILAVGNFQGGGQSIGTFDDFAYFATALTPGQILEIYNGGCSTSVTEDAWVHLAGRFDGVDAHLYKNGSLQCSYPATGNVTGSVESFSIGARADGSQAWRGEMGALQVYSSGTPADISANFLADVLRYSYPGSCSDWLPISGAVSGNYFVSHPTLGDIEVYCDQTTDGGGWMLVANYLHQGGTNPAVSARVSFPHMGSSTLGIDESTNPQTWGHAANSLMNQITYTEARFQCRTSFHGRVVDFKTNNITCLNYFKTGIGTCSGVSVGSTTLPGHTANIPGAVNNGFTNRGNDAMTDFPLYRGGAYHWGIRGSGARWECDDQPNNSSQNTLHRIFVR